ncbi:MAG: ABC transporter [Roseateles depolymerans]|uniref:ABC transporter n=1 Tax=Roseateles depolymerans TaxID=76731 RepID=A0A2W5FMB5_9BURK|nr:MAG: ABC transporter [Roseateles depolymerans]
MDTFLDSLQLAWALILGGDAELWRIAALSLRVSGSAVLIGAVLGLWLGAWLAVARFPGHGLIVWMLNTLLALPAVVVGLLVYLLLSRAGPLGSLGLLFTPTAMVVAQSLLVIPLIGALARRVVQAALDEGGDQLRSLGAGPLASALLLLIHERLAVLTLLLTAFGRAVAEVGAVMIVGGNIAGVTRVMTTAIALETSKGDLALALGLGLVLLAIVGVANGSIMLLQWWANRTRQPAASAAQAAPPAPAPPAARPPAHALISLQQAGVHFGDRVALQPLSMTLLRGERLALIGANGSGKTTLLRLMHGLLPHSGQLTQAPLQPEGRPARIAMVFQKPFLLRLSVLHNIWIALWLSGVPAAQRERRCHEALARVGLDSQARRSARALSGGQQQRLALARAWATEPDLLLLDEPTASLDPSAKREVEALIDQMAAAGITLVMSTHNLGQAKRMADRVAYFENGRLVAERPAHQFFTDPTLPPEAAQFLRGELPWT